MIQKNKERIQTFLKYLTLLKELVIRDIKVRYRKSFLGLLWTILSPILYMLIINLVFANLFKTQIDRFPLYVLTGNLVFSFNSEATNQSLMSILGNAQLLKKVYIPKYLFPLSKVVSSLVNLGFSIVSLIIVMIITGQSFHLNMLFMPIPLFLLFIFSLGVGLFLSAVNVFFRDATHLYSVFITLWMYLTPIFYSPEHMSAFARRIITLNPLTRYLTYFRYMVMDGALPDLRENIICIVCSFLMLVFGLLVFKKSQDKFILYI